MEDDASHGTCVNESGGSDPSPAITLSERSATWKSFHSGELKAEFLVVGSNATVPDR
jgi:hypothetical protein